MKFKKIVNNDPARISWCTAIIDRQVGHLTSLIDDLLDISRISRGLIELKKERLEIRDFIRPAVETNQPLIDSRKQQFSTMLPAEPLWVEGDRNRLTQIVSNLINNASKYTAEQGRIELSVEFSEDDISIRVSDNGCGIDPIALPNVFDLFYQVESSLDRSQGGLGIGLALVRKLVEKHGGDVKVFSAGREKGSEFVVRLPRFYLSMPEITYMEPKNGSITSKLHILVVDDNRDGAKSLALLLEIEGHTVQMAHDGQTALEVALASQPDVILLDIGLPGMDGYSVMQVLKQSNKLKRTLFVALTGYGQQADREKSYAAGFDEHLVKPLDHKALNKLLANYRKCSLRSMQSRDVLQ